MYKGGFTLIEMMIAVSVMAVIVMGGTLVFFRSLGSSGVNQAQINIIASSNQVLAAVENSIRYQEIKELSDGVNFYDRDDCITAGKTGGSLSGNRLIVNDLFGESIYSISAVKLTSNSAVISSPNLIIRSVSFKWFCIAGSNDKLQLQIVANDTGLTTSVPDRTISRDINMYNNY